MPKKKKKKEKAGPTKKRPASEPVLSKGDEPPAPVMEEREDLRLKS